MKPEVFSYTNLTDAAGQGRGRTADLTISVDQVPTVC
jgi:hypothetical protein